ncbi:Non-specific serine/threonine protein kinase protein [Dioscorea alata]|uniref:Non-specific serine/threonine protein kinase protein n=1 Tax=Dioscorea alata TaxID=55571 RepID=A0ACB7W793_DIOAL|nr:Non-specific serine/threonine protein kinase protein [Dioscorea alata]
MRSGLGLGFLVLLVVLAFAPLPSESSCQHDCDALASYIISNDTGNLTYVEKLFNVTEAAMLSANVNINKDILIPGRRISVPIQCKCLAGGAYSADPIPYTVARGETYSIIAQDRFNNLTTASWLAATNPSYPATNIPENSLINVTVNCSCGDASISLDYGYFETYPLEDGENLSSVAAAFNFSSSVDLQLLRDYNPGVNFTAGDIVFVPKKDSSGSYHPLNISSSGSGISGGAVAGIAVAGIVVVLALAVYLYFGIYRKRKARKASLLPSAYGDGHDLGGSSITDKVSVPSTTGSAVTGFAVENSVEFPYEELATATNNFSIANKIGEGGYGAVYYAEVRGEKAAIKKMDMKATKAFLAEIKVLTHVHHLNLVRLIGYSMDDSLFLIYEFIDNGNLSQHLRGSDLSGRAPLSWSARVQIALDSARGLEYIHEHTVPVYVHRDIKSANILIDKNFRAKVADFGLAKLTEVGNSSTQTGVAGTFGYMPPEYAQYGEVSPKVDVFAFGVVLYELISAKEAIVKKEAESRGLVALFEGVLNQPDPKEELQKLIDPNLNEYPMDAVLKMAHLAKACTQENPQLRPSMRSIVVALMTLSSATEDWDLGTLYENQSFVSLMSGR